MVPERTGLKSGQLQRLDVELGTMMLATFERASKPIKSLFVGMEPGNYMILRFPSGAGVHDHLFEGNPVVIKFVSEGRIYGFQSQVLGYMYKKRLILVVVAYPANIETHLLRKENRVDFFVPAKLAVAGKTIPGFVVDLSPGGCRFAFEAASENLVFDFNVVKEVRLTFELLGLEGGRDFTCAVKNTKPEGETLSLGLQFGPLEDDVSRAITGYVRQVSQFLGGTG